MSSDRSVRRDAPGRVPRLGKNLGATCSVSRADSQIASSLLLRSVVYPDAADVDDVVRYAYNRQGQRVEQVDQQGSVHVLEYDALAGCHCWLVQQCSVTVACVATHRPEWIFMHSMTRRSRRAC